MAKGTIDESLKQIEDVLSKLESGQVSLEEAFKLYNDGIKLIKNCNGQIDKIEKQIIVLQNGEE
ncbi:MAG: exodeoxyribonuclease VII small subunit [Lachnospiraceae bacterium]